MQVKESKIITKDDIIESYTNWKFAGSETITISEYVVGSGWNSPKQNVTYNKEKFKNRWCTESYSMQWFKSNLGSAILKGRILAIPVIDIQD